MGNFMKENIMLILFLIAGILIVLYRIVKKDEIKAKTKKIHHCVLTKREYQKWKEESENALSNTTISFNARLNKQQAKVPEDFYINTVNVGNKLIEKADFKISKVGRI